MPPAAPPAVWLTLPWFLTMAMPVGFGNFLLETTSDLSLSGVGSSLASDILSPILSFIPKTSWQTEGERRSR